MDPMDGRANRTARRASSVLTESGIRKGVGGVVFSATIVGNVLVGIFRVADGLKMTVKVYIGFHKRAPRLQWYNKNSAFEKSVVFMHDNTPFHGARLITEYLGSVFARHGKIMQWPACSQ